ncbi:MAG: hypothetical protein AAGU19_12285 [Prolixibacteraceae bacterium]
MKRILIYLLVAMTVCINNQFASAQSESADVVTLMNGNEMKGKVTGTTDDVITFVHQGETLAYTVKKDEINKIKFASGRVETFNDKKKGESNLGGALATMPSTQRNMVAVLPFSYIGQGGEKDEKLSKKVQSDCYNLLLKYASRFSIQDPMKTNALLARQGINGSNLDGFLPSELAVILGTEYVVVGSVLVDYKGTTNNESASTTSERKNNGNKRTTFSLGTSTTTEQFKTQVDLKVYVDDGRNISSESKTSLWQKEDAYQNTLQYLIKRCPLYSK